jgi:hypothetical protein
MSHPLASFPPQRKPRFIGQIALNPELFESIDGRMAYWFMTDDEQYVDGTWKPEGGENAVIVQPCDLLVPVHGCAEGPTLYRMVPRPGSAWLVPEPCEFAVRLTFGEDPEFLAEDDRWQRQEGDNRIYSKAVAGNRIGGTPGFLQSYAFLSRSGRAGRFLWQCS